jgi:molybdopterin/thiamine biosynthesis adenylyltransferase
MAMGLNEQQIERYSRHIMLEQVGGPGQEKLLESKVLIIGAGGLGSPAALYLAAAGVGTIGIIDADKVEITNLQRQVLYCTDDAGTDKVSAAKARIQAINPDVTVPTYKTFARAENITDIIRDYDFVIDCTDNFDAKFLINDACYFEKKPFSHAGVFQFTGQLITILPSHTCYRCTFHRPPPPDLIPSCSQIGIFGVLPAVIGSLQATEALKYLLAIGDLLTNSLLTYNVLEMEFHKVPLNPNPNCILCGPNPQITKLQPPVCQ